MIGRGLNRLYHRRGGLYEYNPAGIDIFSEDWDNCLILDACPYSLFEQQNTIDGRLESRTSRASATVEFLESNIAGRDLRDVVYITANPQYERNHDRVSADFHEVIRVYDDQGWNDDVRTVLPSTMTDAVIEAGEKYPNKRLLAHYIQPHYPFLGETAEQNLHQDSLAIWRFLIEGELDYSDEILRQAFIETLDIALPEVKRAIDSLEGKTVVTADHGQIIGERAYPIPIREYGHPRGIYIPELVNVPWLICDGDRKTITEGEPSQIDMTDVTERLRDLGYTE